MAYDLIFGITKKSWARGSQPATLALPPTERTIICTPREKAGLEELASIKMAAESGDRKAQARWKALNNKFTRLSKASDPKAKHSIAILRQAGFLQGAKKISFSSGEPASFDDAWGQVKKYGEAVEKKDTKAARDAIEWMILRGWKASNVAGAFPSYNKITWSNDGFPGKKIAFSTTGSAYAVAIVSGDVGPRKAWADSEAVPQGARKPWDDKDSPLPSRKSWIDDEIPILTRRAKAGDVSAQIALRKIALRKAADEDESARSAGGRGRGGGLEAPEGGEMSLGDSFMGDEREESSFIGDAIPHDTYRAAVMLTAIKDAGGRNPTTKDFFAAKSKIDNKLGNMGVAIYIPGARPSRKTY